MFSYLGRSPITMRPFLHLDRSPITMRPLFLFSPWVGHPLQWDNLFFWLGHPLQCDHSLCFFYLGWSPITMRPFFHLGRSPITMRSLFFFYLGRSLITMRPSQKLFFIFFLRQVTHDNLIILKSFKFQKTSLPIFTLSVLSSPQNIHHFLIWWAHHHLILIFFLHNTYYLKSLTRLPIVSIVKRGTTVITQFWVIPKNLLFLKKIKMKK